MQRRLLLQAASGSVAVLGVPRAFAQAMPSGPIRIVVGFPRGGGTDALARVLAERLEPLWGRQVVIDNKPGVAGVLAASHVAQQPGDGRTLLMAHINSHALAPLLQPRLTYDVERDFTPVVLVGVTPNMLAGSVQQPVRTLDDLVALCQARPGRVSFGSSGAGSVQHLSLEMFKLRARIDLLHIPYKGSAPVLADVVNGLVDCCLVSMTAVTPFVKSGKLVAIAQTRPVRAKAYPGVPTMAEQGFPGFDASVWYGLVGPARLPRGLVQKINADVNLVLAMPGVQRRLDGYGAEDGGGTPEKFGAFMRAELAKWTRVVKDSGLKP